MAKEQIDDERTPKLMVIDAKQLKDEYEAKLKEEEKSTPEAYTAHLKGCYDRHSMGNFAGRAMGPAPLHREDKTR